MIRQYRPCILFLLTYATFWAPLRAVVADRSTSWKDSALPSVTAAALLADPKAARAGWNYSRFGRIKINPQAPDILPADFSAEKRKTTPFKVIVYEHPSTPHGTVTVKTMPRDTFSTKKLEEIAQQPTATSALVVHSRYNRPDSLRISPFAPSREKYALENIWLQPTRASAQRNKTGIPAIAFNESQPQDQDELEELTPHHAIITAQPTNVRRKTARDERIMMLLKAGADTSLKNNAGQTVFDLTDDEDILERLRNHATVHEEREMDGKTTFLTYA